MFSDEGTVYPIDIMEFTLQTTLEFKCDHIK